MYKTLRTFVVGTSLAVFPAVPFYIYTFDTTPRQLAILVPLFVPLLLAMLSSDSPVPEKTDIVKSL